jgi:hypothetical protein
MTAKMDLPAADGSTGVWVDGKPVAATKVGNRWIAQDEVSGSVTVEVQ